MVIEVSTYEYSLSARFTLIFWLYIRGVFGFLRFVKHKRSVIVSGVKLARTKYSAQHAVSRLKTPSITFNKLSQQQAAV